MQKVSWWVLLVGDARNIHMSFFYCKMFHGGFFKLEMLEIFTRANFIENHY